MPTTAFAHRLPALLLGSLLLVAGTAAAAELEVSNARLRLLPGDLPAAGYFTLRNAGDAAVTLTGAQSPAFGKVMLHQSTEKNGMASMHSVDSLRIAPGTSLNLAPGGYHLMFMQRSADLAVGDSIDVTLEFKRHDPLGVTFDAVSPAAR